jgi:predicted nucleotidyltransferase
VSACLEKGYGQEWKEYEITMKEKSSTVFTVDELKKLLIPVFQNYNVRRAVLFGSYSKGSATPESDVDLMVDSGLKGLKFVGLIGDIKQSLCGKEVDVLDVTHIDSGSSVDREIRKTGVEIYAK